MDSPLVGRSRQLGQLRQAFEAGGRRARLPPVHGARHGGGGEVPADRGGARHDRAEALVLRGRCLSYGEGITYWPLVEVVRDAIGGDTDPADGRGGRRARSPEPPPRRSPTRVAAVVGGSADAVRDRARRSPGRSGGSSKGSRPNARSSLVLDDVHWAEPTLLDLVDQLADWSRDAPILVICMARPELLESSPGWGGGKLHATTVALEPLSGDEVAHLVENFLAGGVLDDALRRRIDEAAGGNPLFVEETLAMLVDDGLLRQEDGRWVAPGGDLDHVAVPPTIQALLAARLDRLDEADRLLMGRASVVGLSFYLGALRDLTPEPERGTSRIGSASSCGAT